jgi:hypothetical protein
MHGSAVSGNAMHAVVCFRETPRRWSAFLRVSIARASKRRLTDAEMSIDRRQHEKLSGCDANACTSAFEDGDQSLVRSPHLEARACVKRGEPPPDVSGPAASGLLLFPVRAYRIDRIRNCERRPNEPL